MNEPELAEEFPDEPLPEQEATELVNRPTTRAVWVMDHDETTRETILGPDAPADAVIELVIETDESFQLYSYTHRGGETNWVTYGDQPKGDGFETTLASYRLLAGETTTDVDPS